MASNARILVCLTIALAASRLWADDSTRVIKEGREIFEHEWHFGEPMAEGGDGLGPVFNDRSCVACHNQGAVGGGGPRDKNVELLAIKGLGSPTRPEDFRLALSQLHPALVQRDSIRLDTVLHRFSTEPNYDLWRDLRSDIRARDLLTDDRDQAQRRFALTPVSRVSPMGTQARSSQRNTPALFGAGLIDQVPDALLHKLELTQPRQYRTISGRVGPVRRGVGRFGWRAQTEHLADFVQDACANEVGLQIPTRDQAVNPLRPQDRAGGLDLNESQVQSLVAFVRSLPAPSREMPADPERLQIVERGHQLFEQVGCAACHVQDLGPAEGLFSDLLLHDLGPALSDPVVARPPDSVVAQVLRAASGASSGGARVGPPQTGGSYGGSSAPPVNNTLFANGLIVSLNARQTEIAEVPGLAALAQEWRTAPLWGLRDSAPYLHDGRAATVIEAIAYHGGEAQEVTARFLALPLVDQSSVLTFLDTLVAPQLESLPSPQVVAAIEVSE